MFIATDLPRARQNPLFARFLKATRGLASRAGIASLQHIFLDDMRTDVLKLLHGSNPNDKETESLPGVRIGKHASDVTYLLRDFVTVLSAAAGGRNAEPMRASKLVEQIAEQWTTLRRAISSFSVGRFLVPVLDMLLASRARFMWGTPGSTFSGLAHRIWEKFWCDYDWSSADDRHDWQDLMQQIAPSLLHNSGNQDID
jgi:hypothetical protein